MTIGLSIGKYLFIKAGQGIVAAGLLILEVFLIFLHGADHILVIFGDDHLLFRGIDAHPAQDVGGPGEGNPPQVRQELIIFSAFPSRHLELIFTFVYILKTHL